MKIMLLFALLAGIEPAVAGQKPEAEEMDLGKLTEKYWAEGKDSELGVVQNRKYTTDRKIELSVFAGSLSTDPFLSVQRFGLSGGFHFTPYTSVHLIGWKTSVSGSDALHKFEAETGSTVNTNHPLSYFGAEVRQNFIYGKASLFGKSIIYVDLFLIAGAGLTNTESGTSFTPSLGLGQKIYLNDRMSLHLDYRIMTYGENILSKNPSTRGNKVGERTNQTDAIGLGLSFYFL